MTRPPLGWLSVVWLAIVAGAGAWAPGRAAAQGTGQGSGGASVPKFQVDPTWPKLPNNWILGETSSVAVDRRDHVWVLHRPRTVPAERRANAAPPVLEFDAAGNFVQGLGGPSDAYEWPLNEHAIHLDHKDRLWIGGNNPQGQTAASKESDDMLLKFTNKGKFISQIGRRNQSRGNADTTNLKRPADVFVYAKTNEAFVADGYGNRRVIVLDADTGAFKRMWGAFANAPLDPPPPPPAPVAPPGGTAPAPAPPPRELEGPGPQQFGIVHGLKVSNDGLVYVADRGNSRIQVFTLAGKYMTQAFINRRAPGALTVAGLAFSPDPQQEFIYAVDQSNSYIHVVRRKTLEVVDSIGGRRGLAPGEFTTIHHIAADSKGNLYTAEAQVGRRAQKFTYVGMGPATPRASVRAADAGYHHVHFTAPDPEEAAQWYIKHMGCEAIAARKDAAQCGMVQLLFFRRAPTGPSEGTGAHHIGFSFLNLAARMRDLEAAGVKIVTPMREGKLKVGFVEDPWGTRIEVVEDPESLGLYHVHLHSPDPAKTLKWYQDMFGGRMAKRKLTGLDGLLYGKLWLLVTPPAEQELPFVPTEGRAIDHLGFSFADLDSAVAELKQKGIALQQDPRTVKNAIGQTIKVAFLVGPDNVRIELLQPPPN